MRTRRFGIASGVARSEKHPARRRRLGFLSQLSAIAIALAVVAAGGGSLAAPTLATAVPGTPGDPQPGTEVFMEDFEAGASDSPVLVSNYVGATGQRYAADPQWLTNCNGLVGRFSMGPGAGWTNCPRHLGSGQQDIAISRVRQLAYALGQHAGAASPNGNYAVSSYSDGGDPGPDRKQIETVTNIPLATASGRFLTFTVDTAAMNCFRSGPLFQFWILDDGGAAEPVGDVIDTCATGSTLTVPAVGTVAAIAVNVGTYTPDEAFLFGGGSVGIRLTNGNGSGLGNDASFDNLGIIDVTPQLDKTFSPSLVTTGEPADLTFTITNTSELAAKAEWSFADDLPDGLTIAGSATAETTCSEGVVTAPDGGSRIEVSGNLDAGEASCSVTVQVTSDTAGAYTNGPNDVSVVGLNEPGTATVTFESPALDLVKRAGDPVDVNGNGITDAGDTIQYSFDVENAGDVTVTGLAIDDPKAGAVTCEVTELAAGEGTSCEADQPYVITADDVVAGAVENTATATGVVPSGAEIVSNPSLTSNPAEAPSPGLSIVKSADGPVDDVIAAGQEYTYHFVVTNTGNVALADVSVVEGEFSGTGELSEITCDETVLAPEDQALCSATYTLTQADVEAGQVNNSATAIGTPPGADEPITSDPSSYVIPVTPAPGIVLEKTADTASVSAAGQLVNYEFQVTNSGNVTLTDIGVDEVAFSGSAEPSEVDCPDTTLYPGQYTTCSASYALTQADIDAGGMLVNTATATGIPSIPETPIVSDPSTVEIPVVQTPAISIVKDVNSDSVEVGQVVDYAFRITNSGNVTLADFVIDETEFSGAGELSGIECPALEPLAPGDDVTCSATYTVMQEDIDAGGVTNTATVTGTTLGGDPTAPSDPSTAVLVTEPAPGLSFVKTADVSTISEAGQIVTYSFEVTNTGNVSVTEPRVNELEFTGQGELSEVDCPAEPSRLLPGESITCAASYTVVAADLVSGAPKVSNTATATVTVPAVPHEPLTSEPSTVVLTPNPATPVVPGPVTPVPGVPGVSPPPMSPANLSITGGRALGASLGTAAVLVLAGGVLLALRRRIGRDA
ncbi:DUF7507 domain-containing protein [Leucobacter sp. USHLN153]|uniref:DUF7507 domain-containing protein n=1 Tax=Leucobacter sp. USHLN153 TaxID=3081268 RepID=UPI00301633EF